MSEDAGFQKGIKVRFDKLGQAGPGLQFDLDQKGFEVFLDHLVEDGWSWPSGDPVSVIVGYSRSPMALQHMAEAQHRGLIGHRHRTQVDTRKPAHRHRVVEGFLHPRIREIEPLLQKVHPQHHLNAFG
jgi:hypothetical protein